MIKAMFSHSSCTRNCHSRIILGPFLGELQPTMLHVQQPLSVPSPRMNASYFRIIQPLHACLMSLHFRTHSGTQICQNLATVHAIQQLTHTLLSPMLARPVPCSLAHYCASHLRTSVPCVRTPIMPCTRPPIAPHTRAPIAPMLLLDIACATHTRPRARYPVLLVPMPQRTPYCRALANAPALPCFCAYHKHTHLLPRLGTRAQAKPRQLAP